MSEPYDNGGGPTQGPIYKTGALGGTSPQGRPGIVLPDGAAARKAEEDYYERQRQAKIRDMEQRGAAVDARNDVVQDYERTGGSDFAGEAACDSRIIYGARGRDGMRRGKLAIEQMPSRRVLRLRMLGFDSSGRKLVASQFDIDADGFEAMRLAFDGYTTKIERPKAITPDEDADVTFDALRNVAVLAGLSPKMREVVRAALDAADRVAAGVAVANGRRRMDFDDSPAPAPNLIDDRIDTTPERGYRDGYAESAPPNGGGIIADEETI